MKNNEDKTLITNPIEENTLDLFIGRDKELEQLNFYLNSFNIVVIEGDFGVGKTSLGNYYRFSKNFLTPEMEISTDPQWKSKDFLHELIKSLLGVILKEKQFLNESDLRPFIKRYNYLLDKKISVELLGSSVNIDEDESVESVQTINGLKSDLIHLTKLIESKGRETVIQLNNLDLGNTFSAKDMISFFSLNRNIFQIATIKWILTGSIGLKDFFVKNLEKFDSLLIEPIRLKPLNNDNMIEAIKKRNLNIFDDVHLAFLVKDSNLRNILKKLLFLKTNPNSPTLLEITTLTEKENELLLKLGLQELSQKDIAQALNISVPTTSTRLNELILKRIIVKNTNNKKANTNTKYRLSFDAYVSIHIKGFKI